jgi:hypothetical protein
VHRGPPLSVATRLPAVQRLAGCRVMATTVALDQELILRITLCMLHRAMQDGILNLEETLRVYTITRGEHDGFGHRATDRPILA